MSLKNPSLKKSPIELIQVQKKSNLKWNTFNVICKVLKTKVLTSKNTNNDYQQLICYDNSCYKIINNCTKTYLEPGATYEMEISSSKKSLYEHTIFLVNSSLLDLETPIVAPPLNLDAQMYNSFYNSELKLKIKSLSPIGNGPEPALENLMSQEETDFLDYESQILPDTDYLVSFEEVSSKRGFYLRLFANDPRYDIKEFTVGSIWAISNPYLTRKMNSENINIKLNNFSYLIPLNQSLIY